MKLPTTFSPLRTSGTALPGNLLLAVKLMLFCLIVKGYVLELPGVWLPMWPALDHLPSVATAKVLKASFCLGTLLVFLHRNVRIGAIGTDDADMEFLNQLTGHSGRAIYAGNPETFGTAIGSSSRLLLGEGSGGS